jgi:hypothetical protein
MRKAHWLVLAALCGGCGDDVVGDGGSGDLAKARDLAMIDSAKQPDMASLPDLAMADLSTSDLAQPPDGAVVADLATPWPDVPDGLRPPDDGGEQLLLWANADGSQIYTCTPPPDGGSPDAFTWVFTAPAATLFDPANGNAVGKHFAGPTWQLDADMSEVIGQTIAKILVDPMAIPWLLLKAVAHMGAGLFTQVDYVQRLRTQGGIAPTSGCNANSAGGTTQVPYSASYYFYGHP